VAVRIPEQFRIHTVQALLQWVAYEGPEVMTPQMTQTQKERQELIVPGGGDTGPHQKFTSNWSILKRADLKYGS
jgi:hypothetical protein